MSFINVALILSLSSYFVVHALDCNSNPCGLGGYFSPQRGYQCLQSSIDALCTCPYDGYEINQPCRVCNRTNPVNNPCIPSPSLISCLETADFGRTFACLCRGPSGPAVTSAADCNLAVTLTSTVITTSSTSVLLTAPVCFNGGNLVDGSCHCPSGYGGALCRQKFDLQLCERIICQNNGVCANRNPKGPNESVCLCPYGTSGDYCHLIGTLGFCSPNLCLNDALCQETVNGSTRHAYCECTPGYNGIRCETRYFTCSSSGKFSDYFMHGQSKYFQCTQLNGSYHLERRSCAKGLRFNAIKNTCTY